MLGPDRPAATSELRLESYREQARNSAIVFLHASGKLAQVPSTLVEFLNAEPELGSWDILKIAYPDPLTNLSRRRPRYSELAEQFYQELTASDEFKRYSRLAIIAHSIGGLIARKAVLDHPDLAKRVSNLILLAVPNSGLQIPFLPRSLDSTKFLKMASAVMDVAPFAGLVPMSYLWRIAEWYLEPVTELLSGSEWIKHLNQHWREAFGANPPFKYWAIAGQSDRVVGVDALFNVPFKNRLLVAGNHVSLIRPGSVADAGYVAVRSALDLQPIPTAAHRAAEALAIAERKQRDGCFDVVLCHGWADREAVHAIGNRLRQAGLNPWITEELHLEGRKWTDVLKQKIDLVGAIAICTGSSKPPEKEQADLVPLFETKNRPVVPIFLPACAEAEPQPPEVLQGYPPIDFRDRDSEPFRRLVRTLIGKEPDYLPPGSDELPELYEPMESGDMRPDDDPGDDPGGKTGMLNFFGIAGAAGVALFVLLKIYGKVLEQKIFPTLLPDEAFRLLLVVLILVAALTAVAMMILAVQKRAGRFAQAAIVVMMLAMLVTVGYTIHAGPGDIEAQDGPIIRGTVVDEKGNTIPRAFVSVTGFPGSTTDADGSFHLASHVHSGQEVELHIGAAGFEGKTQTAKTGSAVSITLQRDAVKPVPVPAPPQSAPVKTASPQTPSVQPAKTGDAVIDRVLANLGGLQRGGQASEADLAHTLAPLFNRQEFYSVSSNDWQAVLYPLCRTRLLLEQNLENFKSNPAVRESLTQANRQMAVLQDRLAALYGPNFHLSDNIRLYNGKVDLFKRHLPPVIDAPSAEVLAACNEDIKTVRGLIKKAGFPIR